VFGVAFMLRALADAAPRAHPLVYASPLGWIEQVHPLTDPRPIWLVPVLGLIAALVAATIALAGRDLGTSTWTDRDRATARTALLNGPVRLTLRLSRAAIASWLAAALIASWLYGYLAVGILAGALGAWRFTSRDLQSE
jgi:ABC-2 type transport system permease protein